MLLNKEKSLLGGEMKKTINNKKKIIMIEPILKRQ
jgi:hypothetical protein